MEALCRDDFRPQEQELCRWCPLGLGTANEREPSGANHDFAAKLKSEGGGKFCSAVCKHDSVSKTRYATR